MTEQELRRKNWARLFAEEHILPLVRQTPPKPPAFPPLFSTENLLGTYIQSGFDLGQTAQNLAGQWAVRQTVGPMLGRTLGAAAGPAGILLGGLVGGLFGGLFGRRRSNRPTAQQLQAEMIKQGTANSLAQQKAKIDAAQQKALLLTNLLIADALRQLHGANRYDAQRQGIMTLAALPELNKMANQAQMNALQQQANTMTQLASLDQQRKLQLAQMNLQAQLAHQQMQQQRQAQMASMILPWVFGGQGFPTQRNG